jgi:hypothetical protein
VNWSVVLSKQAAKDAKKIASAGLKPKAEKLINVLQDNPYSPPRSKISR